MTAKAKKSPAKKRPTAKKRPARSKAIIDPKIAPELRRLLEPVEQLRPYGRNPRRGDVAAIADSLAAHGQYKPIVARRETGEVLVGNHTLQAAIELGWTRVAVLWRSVPDDEEAARIVLADNCTHDLGGYDPAALVELLGDLPDLGGTGFTQASFAELAEGFAAGAPAPPAEFPDPEHGMTIEYECPQCGYEWSGKPRSVVDDAAGE